MRERRSRVLPLILLALAVAVCLTLLWYFQGPRGAAGEKRISLSITYGDGREEQHELQTDEAYLREAVEQVATIDGEATAYGYTLYTVNGETHDFRTESRYWAIYVDGELGQNSLDTQPIVDGGVYALIVESY